MKNLMELKRYESYSIGWEFKAWLLDFSVSSIYVIWVFPLHFNSVKEITESSIIFLRNGVLILNWKENKEAGAICFEIRIPRKKNKELLRKVPSKIYGSYFIIKGSKIPFISNLKKPACASKWDMLELATLRYMPD